MEHGPVAAGADEQIGLAEPARERGAALVVVGVRELLDPALPPGPLAALPQPVREFPRPCQRRPFAPGPSRGTMGSMCPVTVSVTAKLVAGMDPAIASPIFFGAVGSVLAGAVFGDHCSPISDTTVLSSTASGCRHEEHVWTQMPYALAAALVSMGIADVMCSQYKQPWYYALGAGAAALLLVVFVLGRKTTAPPASATTGQDPMLQS